jgi:hypothetical protein
MKFQPSSNTLRVGFQGPSAVKVKTSTAKLGELRDDLARLRRRVNELQRLRNRAEAHSRRRKETGVPWHRVGELLGSS